MVSCSAGTHLALISQAMPTLTPTSGPPRLQVRLSNAVQLKVGGQLRLADLIYEVSFSV